MPATYAHWQFGDECIKKMPENLQSIVREYRDIYDLGVHGPDIFFYDLLHSKVTKYGSDMHMKPIRLFFETCKETLKNNDEKKQILAYIMGFYSHFILDSCCHGYVERKLEVSKVTHNLIESQWEKHLIILDGRKPNLVDRAESLKPSKQNSKIIAKFFPFNSRIMLRTCKMQRIIIHAMFCISPTKDKYLKKLLKLFKQDNLCDLLIGFEDSKDCKDSNLRLDKLRELALKRYSKLLKNLLNYLDGKQDLDKYFEHDLGPWPDYKNIEVLPYKKEISYKI